MTENKRPILLFAGTSEGRSLAGYLAQTGWPAFVSVATDYGREIIEEGIAENCCLQVIQGHLDEKQIGALIERKDIGLVIDATHPYAELVTGNILRACQAHKNVCLVRCLREKGSQDSPHIRSVPDLETAVRWLSAHPGNILAVTGSKELALYTQLPDYRQRVYARVLPSVEGVESCKKLGFEGRHIIAMQGPFSVEMNLAQLQEYDCRYLVTKDGGNVGGFSEKIEAAERAGAIALVVERPKEEGLSMEQAKEEIRTWIKREEEGAHG